MNARANARGIGQYGIQHRAVAQVQVPIIGTVEA